MANQTLAQTGALTHQLATEVCRQRNMPLIERLARATAQAKVVGFSKDAVAILSGRPNRKPVAALWELCRVYAAGLAQGEGPVKVGGLEAHYLNFKNFACAYGEIFVRGSYVFRPAQPAPRIIDCGANIGLATLFFKMHWPESAIYCFEPDPQTYSTLTLNIAQNGLEHVLAFNVALWDSDGEIEFHVPRSSPGSLRMSALPGRTDSEKIHVQARRLSSFLGEERIDLLKMDVEGAEYRILRELRTSGKLSLIDAIIAEYHHRSGGDRSRLSEFLLLLEGSGFEYQLDCVWRPARSRPTEQDILIYAERARA